MTGAILNDDGILFPGSDAGGRGGGVSISVSKIRRSSEALISTDYSSVDEVSAEVALSVALLWNVHGSSGSPYN